MKCVRLNARCKCVIQSWPLSHRPPNRQLQLHLAKRSLARDALDVPHSKPFSCCNLHWNPLINLNGLIPPGTVDGHTEKLWGSERRKKKKKTNLEVISAPTPRDIICQVPQRQPIRRMRKRIPGRLLCNSNTVIPLFTFQKLKWVTCPAPESINPPTPRTLPRVVFWHQTRANLVLQRLPEGGTSNNPLDLVLIFPKNTTPNWCFAF